MISRNLNIELNVLHKEIDHMNLIKNYTIYA